MKVSELIKELREAKAKHGDLPVITSDSSYGKGEVRSVAVWTASGNSPDGRRRRTDPAVEIQLY